jgi:coenzyme PQQ synthesis protein D (PqqD)
MSAQVSIHPEVRTTPGDEDGSVLINLQSGKVFSLNGVGARIWTMLEHGTSVDGVLDALSREYNLPSSEVESDLDDFIDELARKDLLKVTARSRSGH